MIKPELPGGFKDYPPSEMIPRQAMFDKIRQTFELFGFVPLETSTTQKDEVLTGGESNIEKQIYKVYQRSEDKDDGDLALRFDLTVPLARFIAKSSGDLLRPFKRYEIGKVWRGERQQAGRYREFVQFDADIVGSASMTADAEIICLIYRTMKNLGIDDFIIKVNNRKILNGLSEYAGFAGEKNPKVLRAIDKMDKIGWEGVEAELVSIGLSNDGVEKVRKLIEIKKPDQEATLNLVGELMSDYGEASEGVAELKEILKYVKALGVPDDAWAIDLSVARGLGYYTGPVFEAILTKLPSIGSVFSGGRYNDLVSKFSSMNVPATGASVGVDRLFAAMKELNLVGNETKTVSQVMVLDFEPAVRESCLKVLADLRNSGIPSEIYMGSEKGLKEQLTFAVKQNLPIVVIIGGDEDSRGMAKVKDINKKEQIEVSQREVSEAIKKILSI